MIMAPLGVVQKVLQLPPPSPGTPGPFSLAAPGLLEQAFIAVGFGDVRTESMTVTFEWPSAEAFTSFMRDVTPPINALLANQPEEQKEKVWQAITKVARQHDGGNGRIRMANETIIVVGQRQAEVTVHMDSRRLLTSGF